MSIDTLCQLLLSLSKRLHQRKRHRRRTAQIAIKTLNVDFTQHRNGVDRTSQRRSRRPLLCVRCGAAQGTPAPAFARRDCARDTLLQSSTLRYRRGSAKQRAMIVLPVRNRRQRGVARSSANNATKSASYQSQHAKLCSKFQHDNNKKTTTTTRDTDVAHLASGSTESR